MGTRSLKGIAEPERVYQVLPRALARRFPAEGFTEAAAAAVAAEATAKAAAKAGGLVGVPEETGATDEGEDEDEGEEAEGEVGDGLADLQATPVGRGSDYGVDDNMDDADGGGGLDPARELRSSLDYLGGGLVEAGAGLWGALGSAAALTASGVGAVASPLASLGAELGEGAVAATRRASHGAFAGLEEASRSARESLDLDFA